MKVSLNWAQQYSNVDLNAIGENKLLEKIGAQLGAIEEVDNYGVRFEGIVVVRVISCQPHQNANKLSTCTIDDGGVVKDVERDANGYVQVVCGAPNVQANMLAVWIPPGATVPSTLGKEPLKIESRTIRGQTSHGMLASVTELGIGEDYSGILEVKAAEVGEELAKPGMPLKKLYNLDDIVVDIENKMFTHRPDCFGILGVARELAGIQQLDFKSPDWYTSSPQFTVHSSQSQEVSLEAKLENPTLVPRFMVVAIKDVSVAPSPVWLQAGLTKVGIRPINNIVDITNFVMHLTGQPMHAYDLDKLLKVSNSPTLSLETRHSRKGEKLTLLNGKWLELVDDETILVTCHDVPVGIGGVMGGIDTEVDSATKNIVLECATFDMYNIRRTAMKYGLFTDAVTRFTKGQSPLQNDKVLSYAIKLMSDIAGGQQASDVKDVHGDLSRPRTIKVHKDFINARLGLDRSAEDIASLLRNVELNVEVNGDEITVTEAFWRTDLAIPEDIVEEVGRLYGYDRLPLKLPTRNIKPVDTKPLLATKIKIRNILSAAGANEVLTYTFVHGNLLEKAGQDIDKAFQLANAISPDLQYYRLSLIPSLLEKVHPNIKQGFSEFALFEIGKTHQKNNSDPAEPALPKETDALALVFTANDKAARHYGGAPYYMAKTYLDNLLKRFSEGDFIKAEPLEGADLYNNPWLQQLVRPYEPKRSAVLRDRQHLIWGVVGEIRSSVRKVLKLPNFTAGFEVDPLLFLQSHTKTVYVKLPRFPSAEQDITLRVTSNSAYASIYQCVYDALKRHAPTNSIIHVSPVDIYSQDTRAKNYTFHVTIANYQRTLTTEAVNTLLNNVATDAQSQMGAERI